MGLSSFSLTASIACKNRSVLSLRRVDCKTDIQMLSIDSSNIQSLKKRGQNETDTTKFSVHRLKRVNKY